MKGKIIFIGGIHGVGKGTICKRISNEYSMVHLSASDILKWDEISEINNKKVKDFEVTQERLINGLKNIIKNNQTYLLDGHFTLLNKNGIPKEVPAKTFKDIQPIAIIVITQDIDTILLRLQKRDKNKYNYTTLEMMQKLEIKHSRNIANDMNIPFITITNDNDEPLINFLNKL